MILPKSNKRYIKLSESYTIFESESESRALLVTKNLNNKYGSEGTADGKVRKRSFV
jgi:hypothetical protein